VNVASHERDDWDQHWAEYAGTAAENPAQEFRRRLVLHLLVGVSATSRIVDIGSGTGDLAVSLRRAYPSTALLGLELSSTGVELAQRRLPDAEFRQVDLSSDELPPVEFRSWATHAVCSEVLEHVDDPVGLLANSRPYLAPGCLLVVTVPGGPMTEYDRHIGHRTHFEASRLRRVLTDAGFDVTTSTGAGFPVFNLYRILMRALGSHLVSIAGSSEPSAASRIAMRSFALGMRSTRLSRRGWQIVGVARNGPLA
jgi:trans-aconitate methyltransferase